MKNLLILSQYFWPENFQINSVAENLIKKKDIKVHVFTGLPNYPSGKIPAKYKYINKLYTEKYKNIKIYRCPIYPRKDSNFLNLCLNYLSFVFYGIRYFKDLNINKKIDHILTYSTSPITANLPAIYLKKKYNKKLSIWVQDLWPDSVKSTGYIKNSFLIFLINLLVKFIYHSADQLFIPSVKFKKKILEKINNKKIFYVPNSSFNYKKKRKINIELLKKFKGKNYFVYAGNLGKAQSIENILKAALILKDISDVIFIIIGDGSEKSKLLKFKKDNDLKNVFFTGSLNFETIQIISKHSKATIISLADDKLFNNYIPNKFQNSLVANRPIIFSGKGVIREIIIKNKIGLTSKPEKINDLVKNVLKINKLSKFERNNMIRRCKKLYTNEFSNNAQIEKLRKYMSL